MNRVEKLTEYGDLDALLSAMERQSDPMLDQAGTVTRYLEMKARARGVPLSGTFELTPMCNLDCRMCYVHLKGEQLKGRPLLTVAQWQSLMAQTIVEGMLHATFTGGECLTYPGFDTLYLYLWAHGVRTAILTNGVLLDEARLDFFRRYPPRGIQITLYGSNEEEYEAVTGHRCFARVMENVQRTAESSIPLSIAVTPNRFLPDGGEGLIRLAHRLGIWYSINTALFKPRQETGRADDAIDLTDEDYIRLHTLRRELHGLRTIPRDCETPLPSRQGMRQKGLLCSAGTSAFHIRWDGMMLPCASFHGVEADPLTEGFASAWRTIHAQCAQYPLPQECHGCAYQPICPSCVMAHRQCAQPGHASPALCQRARKLVASGLADIKEETTR